MNHSMYLIENSHNYQQTDDGIGHRFMLLLKLKLPQFLNNEQWRVQSLPLLRIHFFFHCGARWNKPDFPRGNLLAGVGNINSETYIFILQRIRCISKFTVSSSERKIYRYIYRKWLSMSNRKVLGDENFRKSLNSAHGPLRHLTWNLLKISVLFLS